MKRWSLTYGLALTFGFVALVGFIAITIASAAHHQSRPVPAVPIKWLDFGIIAQVRSYPTHVSIQTTRGCFEAPVIYGALPAWKQTFISSDGRKLKVDNRVYEAPTPSEVPKPGDNKVFNKDLWQE